MSGLAKANKKNHTQVFDVAHSARTNTLNDVAAATESDKSIAPSLTQTTWCGHPNLYLSMYLSPITTLYPAVIGIEIITRRIPLRLSRRCTEFPHLDWPTLDILVYVRNEGRYVGGGCGCSVRFSIHSIAHKSPFNQFNTNISCAPPKCLRSTSGWSIHHTSNVLYTTIVIYRTFV